MNQAQPSLPDPSLTLILGGARSGKSRYAEGLVMALPSPWLYVATGEAFDDEMRERIAHHRARRGDGWKSVETPLDLRETLDAAPAGKPVLVDCLTIWLSNVLLAGRDAARESLTLARTLSRPRGPWFVVANEVGLGIIPGNALSRRFRDAAGKLNQEVAAVAHAVVLVVAALPMRLK